jgi:hypothetical protein
LRRLKKDRTKQNEKTGEKKPAGARTLQLVFPSIQLNP